MRITYFFRLLSIVVASSFLSTTVQAEALCERVLVATKVSYEHELAEFRNASPAMRKSLILEAERRFEDVLDEKIGHHDVGFHFNLHGGSADSYVEGGGIYYSAKTPESYFAGNPSDFIPPRESLTPKSFVYFFNARHYAPFELLNERPSLWQSRYGTVLVLFDMRAVERHHQDRIVGETPISFIFADTPKKGPSSHVAVPSEYFLIEPISIFKLAKKQITDSRWPKRIEVSYLSLMILTDKLIASK